MATTFSYPQVQLQISGAATLSEQQAQTTLLTSIDEHTGDIETATNATTTELVTANTSLSAILAKIIAAPATAAKQDSLLAELQLKADLTETQPVSVASLPLPAGAATSAKQDLLLTELQLKADLTETQPVSAASLPLPAGASTSAKQDLLLAELQLKADLTETQPISAASLPLPAGAATSAKQDLLLAELQLKADLTETQPVSAASLPLPSGASTSALQTTGNTALSTLDTSVNALLKPASTLAAVTTVGAVTAITNPLPAGTNKIGTIAQAGKTAVTLTRNDYASVNVTTAAYVQLIASTSAAISEIEIFDSSGQTLVLAIGAAASEVNQIYILPGGNGRIPLSIAAGVRVSIKAVSANATVGEITINYYSV